MLYIAFVCNFLSIFLFTYNKNLLSKKNLTKLYYKLYRNKLPAYFEKFILEYGESQHDLRHNNIRLPAIRCEYEKMNAK